MNNKYFKLEAFKIDDEYELESLNESIYQQLVKNMAKSIDIELAKTPLIDLITGYQDGLVLGFKNQQLEKRINKAIEYIKEHVKLLPDEEGGGLELCDYDVANVLEILRGEFNE